MLPGWCFMLLLWCLPLPERCVLLLLGVLCVRTVFYVTEMVFFLAETPARTREGSDVTSRCFVLPDFLAVSTRVPGDRISWLSREKTSRTKRCRAARLSTEHFGQAGAFSVCRLRGRQTEKGSCLTKMFGQEARRACPKPYTTCSVTENTKAATKNTRQQKTPRWQHQTPIPVT